MFRHDSSWKVCLKRTVQPQASNSYIDLRKPERILAWVFSSNCPSKSLFEIQIQIPGVAARLCPTLLSGREVLCDVVHGVADVVLLGHVHVDQAQEGRALHAQPLQDDGSELGRFSHRVAMRFMLKCLNYIFYHLPAMSNIHLFTWFQPNRSWFSVK